VQLDLAAAKQRFLGNDFSALPIEAGHTLQSLDAFVEAQLQPAIVDTSMSPFAVSCTCETSCASVLRVRCMLQVLEP
jgi:hypothetical protein